MARSHAAIAAAPEVLAQAVQSSFCANAASGAAQHKTGKQRDARSSPNHKSPSPPHW
jgi:hypothetical protein